MSRVASLEDLFRRSCPGICLEICPGICLEICPGICAEICSPRIYPSWDLSGDLRQRIPLSWDLSGDLATFGNINGYGYRYLPVQPLTAKKSRDVFGRFVKSPKHISGFFSHSAVEQVDTGIHTHEYYQNGPNPRTNLRIKVSSDASLRTNPRKGIFEGNKSLHKSPDISPDKSQDISPDK